MSDPKSAVDSEEYHIERHPNHDFMTTTHGIARVLTSDTHVQMGDLTFHKDDFMRAFEGYLNPGLSERPSRAFANPVPLGVASFALSLFVVSLTNIHARGVSNGAGAAGLCLFYAGFIELCAGMWCIVLENAWAATLISSFAGFWMSYGLFLIDGFGIVSSYTNTDDLHNMLGFYLLGWTIFATIMWSMTFRSTWVFFFMMLLSFLPSSFFVVLTLQCPATLLVVSISQRPAVTLVSSHPSLAGTWSTRLLPPKRTHFLFLPSFLCLPLSLAASARTTKRFKASGEGFFLLSLIFFFFCIYYINKKFLVFCINLF